jgi:hypothetical protein
MRQPIWASLAIPLPAEQISSFKYHISYYCYFISKFDQ